MDFYETILKLWDLENYWSFFVLLMAMAIVFSFVYYKYIHLLIYFLATKTRGKHDDNVVLAIHKPIPLLILTITASYGLSLGSFSEKVQVNIDSVISTFGIIIVFWTVFRLISIYEKENLSIAREENSYFPYILRVLKFVISGITIYFILEKWGYDLSKVLTGIGITGVAFAFAARDTFSNIFCGVVIVIERPFAIGNIVSTEQIEGVITDIGFRSTTIRTFDMQEVVVPNSQMINTPLTNRTKSEKRKVEIHLGIKRNETNSEKIREQLKVITTHDPFFKNEVTIEMASIWPETYFFKVKEFTEQEGVILAKYKQDYIEEIMKIANDNGWEIYYIGFEPYQMSNK